GYLKSGTEPMVRFKAAYVAGPYRPPQGVVARSGGGAAYTIEDYVVQFVAPVGHDSAVVRPAEPEPEEPQAGALTVLDVMVGRMVGRGEPAHQVWLPPLKE